jgi:hypothetical protein
MKHARGKPYHPMTQGKIESVNAAAPAGASGKNGPHRHRRNGPHQSFPDFCNKICTQQTRARMAARTSVCWGRSTVLRSLADRRILTDAVEKGLEKAGEP